MKKILSVVLCAVLLLTVGVACSKDEETTKTAEFYKSINKECFWYKANITENGETYTVIQATNGVVTTTIENHEKNNKDKYQLYDGEVIQSLNFAKKCYDTIVTTKGVPFRFANYDPSMFPKAKSAENVTISDVEYFCESFEVSTKGDGVANAVNNYYFKGDRLVFIEIVENGNTTLVIELEDYANEIPEDVYMTVPEGFTGRNYVEENEIDFSDVMDDWFEGADENKK